MYPLKNVLPAVAALAWATLACSVSFGDIGLRSVRGSGELSEETRRLADFNRVEFAALGDLNIVFGEHPSLTIKAEDNLIELFETEVRGDTLLIDLKDGTTIVPTESIRINLTVVELEGLAVSDAGNVDLAETESLQFQLAISGAGNIDVGGLAADRLEVSISGAGDLQVEQGRVGAQEVSISGAGSYEARDLESETAEIQLSGLGSATVWATARLDVSISGAGSVRYAGNPNVSTDVSGLGNISRIGSGE